MAGTRWSVVVVPAVLVAGMALTGCTSSKKKAGAPVTVTASATPSGSVAGSPSSTSSPTASSTAAPRSTRPGPAPTLPRCETVLPATAVDKAIGHRVAGRTAFVVNQPDPTIKQLARINCQYGLGAATPSAPTRSPSAATQSPSTPAGSATVAQVEVSVSLYPTKAAAAARITATDSDWRNHGATGHPVTVGTHRATVLLGYGRPLLVLASGVRTVAVNVRSGAVPGNRVDTALTQIARTALSGSGG